MYFPDSKPLFILSVNNAKQTFLEMILETQTDIYIKSYSCLIKCRFDWKWITFSITFETSGKSETGQ